MQGPPGTGKTSAIIAIISALLAKHYVPPNPKARQPLPGAPSISPAQDDAAPSSSSSSSALPSTNPKQLPQALSSLAPGSSLNSVLGQAVDKGRAGAGTTHAPVPAPKFRILVCAQSNAAIDEVIARLASPGLLMGESSPQTAMTTDESMAYTLIWIWTTYKQSALAASVARLFCVIPCWQGSGFRVSRLLYSNQRAYAWQNLLVQPLGSAAWFCHMVVPAGIANWFCHLFLP